jgi:U32 family peptidase
MISVRRTTPPELLAPCGGWDQLKAAINCGADAVYFGLTDFNARARANNFTLEELPVVMETLHNKGVFGLVTLNTLVFDRELQKLEAYIREIARNGVDAVIVQDIGVIQLIREVAPDLEIHGSTQMTITSAEGAELARRWGVKRVVLARELSLKEIAQICAQTSQEIEVFVHGALCVSYSGQCFSSEAWGGRSANRGACAQACRLPYDLLCDGKLTDLGPYQYLLSPQDLMAIRQIPELVAMGVDCFKIEGRLKGPEYVALTTQTYRKAIDDAWAGRSLDFSRQEERDLEQVFSRGLTPGFLEGARHQRLVQGRAPRHRGVQVGVVHGTTQRGVQVSLQEDVRRGEGLVFDGADPQSQEEGGRIWGIYNHGQAQEEGTQGTTIELRFGPGEVQLKRIQTGDWVWRTDDPQLTKRLKALAEKPSSGRKESIQIIVSGQLGSPLVLTAENAQGHRVVSTGEFLLQPAQRHGLDQTKLEVELSRLGDTPFSLGKVTLELSEGLFCPLSELSRLRHRLVEQLLTVRKTPPSITLEQDVLETIHQPFMPEVLPLPKTAVALHILCRTPEQLEAALELAVPVIYLDYLELYGLKDSVQRIQDQGLKAIVASPRIHKPNEERIWKFLLGLKSDGLLVRNPGLLQTLNELKSQGTELPMCIGDFSLNAANGITAKTLLAMGLERITPTYDLNAQQIGDLAQYVAPQRLEIVLHHHLPVFHTEHCVFARFLSEGDDHTNCGHPCEKHRVALQDRTGLIHPIVADVGCRNTVFHGQAQSGAEFWQRFIDTGITDYRLEFVHESRQEVRNIYACYQEALQSKVPGKKLWQNLQRLLPNGITRGSYVMT